MKKFKAAIAGVAATAALTGSLFGYSLADGYSPIKDDGPEISAEAAVVMDINSGAVLYSKNGDEKLQPSSLTKLMNAYVVLNNTSTTSTVTCSATATSQNYDLAANAGLVTGETISVRDALAGMLLASYEDCSYALAEGVGTTMEGFAAMMNEEATALGLTNTTFTNGTGVYAAEHMSTAYDMAVVASKLMKNYPEYKEIISLSSTTLSATNKSGTRDVKSSHRFMSGRETVNYVYAGKTGGSAHGGDGSYALCTYASYNGLDVVCIIMGSKYLDSAYEDTKDLLAYAFDNYQATSANAFLNSDLTEMGLLFSEYSMFDVLNDDSIYVDSAATIVLPLNYDNAAITSEVVLTQLADYAYGKNKIGEIRFSMGDRFVGAADIILFSSVNAMTHEEFLKLFPSYLIDPENTTFTEGTTNKNTVTVTKITVWTKLKNNLLSLYTTAKLRSLILGVLAFVAGAVLIILLFPKPKGSMQELYVKKYDKYDGGQKDEVSEVRRVRNKAYSDMHEISSYDAKKK